MEKIPNLLERDFTSGNPKHAPLTGRVNPGMEWVLTDPHVIARRKWDGTCVLVEHDVDGSPRWYTRRMVRPGGPMPVGFVVAEVDERTGKTFGWEPAMRSPYVKAFREAVINAPGVPDAGTYELVGPKVNNNPERLNSHMLVRHDTAQELVRDAWWHRALDLEGNLERVCHSIAFIGERQGWEGVVFYGPGGLRAKLRAKDVRELRRVQEAAA